MSDYKINEEVTVFVRHLSKTVDELKATQKILDEIKVTQVEFLRLRKAHDVAHAALPFDAKEVRAMNYPVLSARDASEMLGAFANENFVAISVDTSFDEDVQMSSVNESLPPTDINFLLCLLLNKDEREALIGDLSERYNKMCSKHGEVQARRWYYGQVLRSVGSFALRALSKAGRFIIGKQNKHFVE